MEMRRGLLLILLMAGAVCMSAQDKKERIYQVETNSFWNNWFISAGVGGQLYVGDQDEKASFGKRIAPALDIAVGKWFTPVLGLRGGYSGLQAKGATTDPSDPYVDGTYSSNVYKQQWNVGIAHGEAMINVSNLFWGYKERVYSFIPYLGVGFAHSWTHPHTDYIGLNGGLINRFRLSDAWDFNVELRGLLMRASFGGTKKEGLGALTVGFSYKFPKRDWKTVSTIPMVPASQLDALRDRINSLQGENDALKRDLVAARNKKPEVIVQKEIVGTASRLVVVFSIGKSKIAKNEYMNVEAMAKSIKANAGKTYVITGYADKGTGSAEYNMKLSKKRAEAVRDLMVKDFGVPDSQLKVDYKGGVGNMFYNDASLSRVAIVEE